MCAARNMLLEVHCLRPCSSRLQGSSVPVERKRQRKRLRLCPNGVGCSAVGDAAAVQRAVEHGVQPAARGSLALAVDEVVLVEQEVPDSS